MKTEKARKIKTKNEVKEEKEFLKSFEKKYLSKTDLYFKKMELKRNNW